MKSLPFRFIATRDLQQTDSHDREDSVNWSIGRENPITSPNNAIIVVRANESRGMVYVYPRNSVCRPFQRDEGKRRGKRTGRKSYYSSVSYATWYIAACGVKRDEVVVEREREKRLTPSAAHPYWRNHQEIPPCGLTNQNAASAHAIARKCAILYTVLSGDVIEVLPPEATEKWNREFDTVTYFVHNERGARARRIRYSTYARIVRSDQLIFFFYILKNILSANFLIL